MPSLSQLLPLLVPAVIIFLIIRYSSAEAWHLLAGMLLGVLLVPTVVGPALTSLASAVHSVLPWA